METKFNPKRDLAIKLRQYINHKRVLEKYSDHYKKPVVASSMSKVYDLFKMVKRDCSEYSFETLCQLVRQHENNLRNILPRTTHPHYQKQVQKLEVILAFCKK